jgi:hypothetical protein
MSATTRRVDPGTMEPMAPGRDLLLIRQRHYTNHLAALEVRKTQAMVQRHQSVVISVSAEILHARSQLAAIEAALRG